MPTMEKLPNFRILELDYEALIANKIYFSAQGFPKLESLRLKQVFNLEEWNVDEGAMPCLRRLEIEECSGMKILPDGLRFIATLQEMKIKAVAKELKDKVVEGGEDLYKAQHIPSIIFQDY
ncbi:probable disease resistance RPP8-like protein 4 [Hibiscus syriacus]|uniref:probable disease resistance RPP8-like protein 4 n=1 Tax=Hibiscus syriacus TaxID=106335 RepID=UPI001921E063|nr:probable disease resistance RPP8-like protein 4 [Hibiscus syriacus]